MKALKQKFSVGQALIEYALIISILGVAVIGAILAFRESLQKSVDSIINSIVNL